MAELALPAALSLHNKHALVTGAASGIGRATALTLAALGAHVVITDRSSLDETEAAVTGAGGSCTAVLGDLTDDAVIASFFAGQRIHALAHCAGILAWQPWHEDKDWHNRFHKVMDVNVRVPLQLGWAAIETHGITWWRTCGACGVSCGQDRRHVPDDAAGLLGLCEGARFMRW